jgi:hypothetical protein
MFHASGKALTFVGRSMGWKEKGYYGLVFLCSFNSFSGLEH